MQQDWIFEDNLFLWLEIVASFCRHSFDSGDQEAFEFGIENTDAEQNYWFDYEFSGSCSINLRVACDPGSSVIFVEVGCSSELELRIATAIQIAQEYRLARR